MILALQRNLQLSLTDIFLEFGRIFDKTLEQKVPSGLVISEETINSITSVLDFSIADKKLIESIGTVLLSLAK